MSLVKKKIILASDHAGFKLKNSLLGVLSSDKAYSHYQVVDMGVFSDEVAVDYSDIIASAARRVKEEQALGIFVCGTGIGACITANKIEGLHCALVMDGVMARLAKEHNHVSCISLGQRCLAPDKIEDILKNFIFSKPQLGRHQRRVEKIYSIEKTSSHI